MMMRPLLTMMLYCGMASAEPLAEQYASAPNQALALTPAGDSVVISYHPGRSSVLALLERDGTRLSGLFAVDRRGRFLVAWRSEKTLLVAFVPEDGCAADAQLLRISLPAARRAHQARFRGARGLLRAGSTDISRQSTVNRELPALLTAWGALERRSWPGVSVLPLPDGACPQRWAGQQLLLSDSTGEQLLIDPEQASGTILRGAAWAFDAEGVQQAFIGTDGQLQAGEAVLDLSGFSAFDLLGLDAAGDPLLLLSAEAGTASRVFRYRSAQLELLFEHPGSIVAQRVDGRGDEVVSLEVNPGADRRYFLDHRVSRILRDAQLTTAVSHRLLAESADGQVLLTASRDSYWLLDLQSPEPVRLEDHRPWLQPTTGASTGARAQRSVLVAEPGQILDTESLALSVLGVQLQQADATGEDPRACHWQRQSHALGSTTVVRCGAQARTWTSRLATETDQARARRLQEITDFIRARYTEP